MILLKIIQSLYSRYLYSTYSTLELSVRNLRECCISFKSPCSKWQRPPVKPTRFSWDVFVWFKQAECMYTNECDVCNVCISVENFERFNERTFYSWQKVDGKVQKTCLTASRRELVNMFNSKISVLKMHIIVKREQKRFYNNVKDNLEENEVLAHVDYSDNYSIKDQQKIQSAYFGHNAFSIFTAWWYFRGDEEKVVSKNIMVTSNATDHSRIAPHTYTIKVIEELNKIVQIAKVHVWSDGCVAYFCSGCAFHLIAQTERMYEVTWCYSESHHWKRPMYGVGRTIKTNFFRDVKSGKTQINDAESFAKYADNTINGIKSLYLQEFNDDYERKLNFFKLPTDEKIFYQQWYRRPGDPGVWYHPILSLMHDPDNTCASCRKPYLAKEDWLECKVCEQWFHERCFMN